MFKPQEFVVVYLDESGDEEPLQTPQDLPVFAIAGLAVASNSIRPLLSDFLELKSTSLGMPFSKIDNRSLLKVERKGNRIRRTIRSGSPREKRAELAFLGRVIELLEKHDVRLVQSSRPRSNNRLPRETYPQLVLEVLSDISRRHPSHFASVLDSRSYAKNVIAVRTISDSLMDDLKSAMPTMIEIPFFGHSDTHGLLQIADIIVSGLVAPLKALEVSRDFDNSPFLAFGELERRYAERLENLLTR